MSEQRLIREICAIMQSIEESKQESIWAAKKTATCPHCGMAVETVTYPMFIEPEKGLTQRLVGRCPAGHEWAVRDPAFQWAGNMVSQQGEAMSVQSLVLHVEDADEARTQCARDREAAFYNLAPNDTCKWIVGEQLAAMVWESAYDTALIAARKAHEHEQHNHAVMLDRLLTQRDAEHDTARAWRERYEDQLRITQDLDRRWAAKQRDHEQEIARLRSAVWDAYVHLGAAVVQAIPEDDQIIAGHILAASDVLRVAWKSSAGMPVRESLAQERALSALVGRVEYLETSLVDVPPDPTCALRPESDKDGSQ
jgi:hypothetical protein